MTHTKGNVIVEDIQVGDIHYEYELGVGFKCEVITAPTRTDTGNWTWKSKGVYSGRIVTYKVNPNYAHYGPNLYDHKAYSVRCYI